MNKKLFLHELDNINELYASISDTQAIEPALVEKDYWLMHCLWGLQNQE